MACIKHNAYYFENIPYTIASDLQASLSTDITSGNSLGTFLFAQHPPVITLGRNALKSHILSAEDTLASSGISLAQADRGGGLTYHGPGQILLYPILRIRGLYSVVSYVESLQTVVARTLTSFGLAPHFKKGNPGVWVGDGKISSIGIRIREGITSHGLSLNVFGDLTGFDHITACNDPTLRHTSIEHESNVPVGCDTVVQELSRNVEIVFQTQLVWQDTQNYVT